MTAKVKEDPAVQVGDVLGGEEYPQPNEAIEARPGKMPQALRAVLSQTRGIVFGALLATPITVPIAGATGFGLGMYVKGSQEEVRRNKEMEVVKYEIIAPMMEDFNALGENLEALSAKLTEMQTVRTQFDQDLQVFTADLYSAKEADGIIDAYITMKDLYDSSRSTIESLTALAASEVAAGGELRAHLEAVNEAYERVQERQSIANLQLEALINHVGLNLNQQEQED